MTYEITKPYESTKKVGPYLIKRPDLVHPELYFTITGILFEVFKELGAGYKENYYQKATAITLRKHALQFKEQVAVPLQFKGERIGINFLDFLIEEKIVLELKKGDYFSHQTINQVNQYLRATNLKLGIIAAFTSKGVKTKRIVNINSAHS